MPSFSFILLTVSEKNFEYFFDNLPFMSPRQPIKLSYLDKSRMKHGGLLNKHILISVKRKTTNISTETAEISNFHFPILSLWKLLVAIVTRRFLSDRNKNTAHIEANVLSMYAKMRLHPLMVSKKKILKHFYEN